jgi:hypothetical protein
MWLKSADALRQRTLHVAPDRNRKRVGVEQEQDMPGRLARIDDAREGMQSRWTCAVTSVFRVRMPWDSAP